MTEKHYPFTRDIIYEARQRVSNLVVPESLFTIAKNELRFNVQGSFQGSSKLVRGMHKNETVEVKLVNLATSQQSVECLVELCVLKALQNESISKLIGSVKYDNNNSSQVNFFYFS